MALSFVTRDQWGALPAESFTARNPADLEGVVVHWWGSPSAAPSHDRCDDYLRSVQRSHQAGEFNDVAYGMLVCPHGTIYEGRGFFRLTGANGNGDVNRRFGSVCAMMGTGNSLTPECVAGLRKVIGEFRRLGAGTTIRTHGSITGSTCPGPELTALIAKGGLEPVRTLAPIRAIDWKFGRWYLGLGEFKDVGPRHRPSRPAGYPRLVPLRGWRAVRWYQRNR